MHRSLLLLLRLSAALALARRAPRPSARENLGAVAGRAAFVATLAERGSFGRPHAPREPTALVVDVRLGDAAICDHCWLRGADARALAAVAVGADVAFRAEAEPYYKRGRRRAWRLARLDGVRPL